MRSSISFFPILLTILSNLFFIQNIYGTTCHLPNIIEYYDNGNIRKACIDYVKSVYGNPNDSFDDEETFIYELPNNKKLVIVKMSFSHNEVEIIPDITGHGILDQFGNRHAYVKKKKEVTNKKTIGVFVDGHGQIQKSVKLSKYINIKTIPNNRVLIISKYRADLVDFVYKGITCYSSDGDKIWEYDDDFVIWEYDFTDKNLYTAGGMSVGYYKVFNLSNGQIIDERKTNPNEQARYTKLSLQSDGVHVTENIRHSSDKSHVFPYVPSDKGFQSSLFLKKFNKDNAIDQIALGDHYLNGTILEKNEKRAFEWYMKAANQNNGQGLYKVGYCYYNGLGVEKNKAKSLEYYEKSAKEGNYKVIADITNMYVNGDGVPQNMSKALFWQEILAFKNDKDAQQFVIANQTIEYEKVNLSGAALRDIAISNYKAKNYSWAEFCIKRALELGNNDARLDYGLWLSKGEGVQKDYTKAEELLTPFAESGNKDAAAVLGTIYQNLNDKQKEMYWVEKAALKGDVNSQLRLAEAYQTGNGVKKDKKKAAELYEKAALAGNEDAILKTILNYALGNGVKKDIYEAASWIEKLDVQSQLSIAEMFLNGDEVKPNKKLSALVYLALSVKGNIQAIKNLAMCYLDGNGVDKNIYYAHELIKKLDYSDDGNMYYIEAKFQEANLNVPSSSVVGNYKRAIKYGCSRAIEDFARYKRRYGLR